MSRRLFTLLFILAPAYAVAQTPVVPHEFVVEGRLYTSNGQPLDDTNSEVMFELVSSANPACVLYRETFTGVNFSNPTDPTAVGVFALKLGAGTPVYPATKPSFVTLFSPGTLAGDGCSVSPTAGDSRLVRVSVKNALNGNAFEAFPLTALTAVPTAIVAESANALGGFGPSQFLQVQAAGSSALSQTNLENVFSAGNYSTLTGLLAGGFVPAHPTATVDFNGQRVTGVASPGTSTDAVNKGYADTSLGGRSADFTGVGPAIGDGKTMIWDQAQQKWVAGNPTLTGSAGGDLSGSYPNPVITAGAVTTTKVADNAITANKINTTGVAVNRLVATDATTGSNLTYFTCGVGEIMWWTATGWQCTTVAALAPVKMVAGKTPNASGNVVLNAADITGLGTVVTKDFGTSAGEVPLLDGSGKVPAALLPAMASGTITGVYSVTPLIGGGVTSGNVTLSIDVGTGANQVVRIDGTGKLPVLDGSQLYGVKLGTRTVSSVAPAAAQVLGFNATLSQWEPMSLATSTAITAGTGLVSAVIGANGTINVDVGTAANKIVQLNGSAQLPAVDGSLLYAVNASRIGTRTVSSAAPAAAQVLGFNATLSQWEPMSAAASTAITAGTGLVSAVIGANGTINVDVGTAANKIVQLNGSAQIPAVDGSLVYGVNASKIGTRTVSSVAPAAAQVLAFNATLSQWEPSTPAAIAFPLVATPGISTASAPSYTFNGSTDTGFFSPAASTLALATAGNTRLHVDSGGKIGIGTTSPQAGLDIALTGTGTSAIIVPRDTQANRPSAPVNGMIRYNSDTFRFEAYERGAWTNVIATAATTSFPLLAPTGSVGTPAYSFAGDSNTGLNSTSADQLQLVTGGNAALSVDANSNVGVGTSAPSAVLHVSRAQNASTYVTVENTSAATAATATLLLKNDVGAGLAEVTSSTNAVAALRNRLSISAGSALAGLNLVSDSGTGDIRLMTASVERVRLDSQGRLGIGTSSPVSVLDVFASGTDSALVVPRDTTTNRPTANVANGMIRYNTSTSKFEAFENGGWTNMITASSGGTVTGITTGAGLSGGPISTNGTISVDSTKVVFYGSTGFLPVTDGSNLTNVNALKIANRTVATSTPATGQYLGWNGSRWEPTSLAFNAPLLAPNGTSTAPAYAFSSAPNSGMWWDGNALQFAVGGTGIVNVDSSGLTLEGGLNQSEDSSRLYSATSAAYPTPFDIGVAVQNTNTIAGTATGITFNVSQSSNQQRAYTGAVSDSSGFAPSIVWGQQTGTNAYKERMRLDPAGSIGIGTSSPKAVLDIAAAPGTNSALIVPRDTQANRPAGNVANGMIRYNTSTSKFEAYESGAWTNMIVTASGSPSFPLLASPGTTPASAPSYAFTGSTNTGLLSQSAGTLALGTNGTARLTVDGVGNVGVGVWPPAATLDVGLANATFNPGTTGLVINTTAAPLVDGFTSASGSYPAANLYQFRGRSLAASNANVTVTQANTMSITGPPLAGTNYNQTNAAALFIASGNATSGGNTANAYGLYVNAPTGGVSNYAAIFLGGKVGIGTNTPKSVLELSMTGTNSALLVPRDTQANRPAANVDNGMIRYNTSVNKLEAYENGAWVNMIGGGGSSLPFSSLTAATATNSFDNLNYGQTWFWTTANTQTPLTIAANALTTGGGLAITSSSSTFASSSGLLNVANTGASTSGVVARLQSNSTAGSGVTLLANGRLGVGVSTPNSMLDVGGQISTGQGYAIGGNQILAVANGGSSLGLGFGAYSGTSANNLAIGNSALNNIGAGTANTAVGYSAGASVMNGSFHTIVGGGAGSALVGGSNNTIIGYQVGFNNLTSGSSNILIGTNGGVDTPGTNTSNFLNIGNGLFGTGVNGTLGAAAGTVRIGIGTNDPAAGLDVATTGTIGSAIIVPRDTTGNRPTTPVNGMLRYNTSLARFEAYEASSWNSVSNVFPMLATTPGTASAPAYAFAGNTTTGLFSQGPNALAFATYGTARLLLDAAGDLTLTRALAGTTLTVANTQTNAISGAVSPTVQVTNYMGTIAGGYPRLSFDNYRGTTTTRTATQSGDYLGQVQFSGYDGSAVYTAGFLRVYADVNATTANHASVMEFGIAGTSGNPSIKMRDLGGGYVGMAINGTVDPGVALKVTGSGPTSSSMMVPIDSTSARPNGINGMLRYNNTIHEFEGYAGGSWGSFVQTDSYGKLGLALSGTASYLLQLGSDSAAKPGSSTWTIASDVRLKDVRAPFTRGLSELSQIETIYFRYKPGNPLGLPSNQEFVGIRAQDAARAVPEAVSVDDKGYLHLTNDAIIWTMVNAIKELYHNWTTDRAEVQRELATKSDQLDALKNDVDGKNRRIDELERRLQDMSERLERLESERSKPSQSSSKF